MCVFMMCITNLWGGRGSADLVPCLDESIHQTGRPWWARRWSLRRSQTAQLRTSPPLWPISSSMTCHWLVLQNRTKNFISHWAPQEMIEIHINTLILLVLKYQTCKSNLNKDPHVLQEQESQWKSTLTGTWTTVTRFFFFSSKKTN